jgi:hypothetical protein
MDIKQGWDHILDNLVEYAKDKPSWRVCRLLDDLFDQLSASLPIEMRVSNAEVPEKRAGFIWEAGAGLYNRGLFALSVAISEHALELYREIEGVGGTHGIYACYGQMYYCYRAIGDQEKALEYERRTLQVEKLLRLAGVK